MKLEESNMFVCRVIGDDEILLRNMVTGILELWSITSDLAEDTIEVDGLHYELACGAL